jgi:hypothetical protein
LSFLLSLLVCLLLGLLGLLLLGLRRLGPGLSSSHADH